ncbi:hypothetical protein BGZ98_005144, partial [Dissophora globulifera]
VYEVLVALAFLVTGVPYEKFDELLVIRPNPIDGAASNKVTVDIEHFVKLGRENRMHDSPTVLWNGTIESSFSSGWVLDKWKQFFQSRISP